MVSCGRLLIGLLTLVKPSEWPLPPNHDGAPRTRRRGRMARNPELPRNSLRARSKPGFRLLGSRRRRESGRRFRPTISPTSITTSTAYRKASEPGLRGYTLLGRRASSARSISSVLDGLAQRGSNLRHAPTRASLTAHPQSRELFPAPPWDHRSPDERPPFHSGRLRSPPPINAIRPCGCLGPSSQRPRCGIEWG
jgi:hypothetical protein